jgi:class 3 adenylate cyclase
MVARALVSSTFAITSCYDCPDMNRMTWLRRVPDPVVDAGIALLLAVAVTAAIRVAPRQGLPPRPPGLDAYALGLLMAALALFRRRWPLAVLLATAATIHVYNLSDNPGLFPAVPLSVSLATAWASGYRRWALLITLWFAGSPFVFWLLRDPAELPSFLADSVPDVALFAAVLLLGEAIRGRRALDRAHRLLVAEQARSERLLRNVLPAPIAARLKDEEGVIADAFPDVTVLFADLVDFTRRSDGVAPEQVVQVLDDLFSAFDALAERHGLEKIKTIGDAYMVAGGLPEPRPDHAEAVADMALAIRDEVAGHVDPGGSPLAIRIGIDSGPVVAGVIGRRRFIYDVWGDTVNTASRMEAGGLAGCIQVTARTRDRLRDAFRFEPRGPIPVKGKGEMDVYLLLGRNSREAAGPDRHDRPP